MTLRAALKGKTAEQITASYHDIFVRSPSGETVLADLQRRIGQQRIDAQHPDANACIYQAAQLALLAYITSRIEKENDDRIVAGNYGHR